GNINEDETVPLSSLEAFYIEDTDGGAHEAWLEEMKEEDNIHEESVRLHDVASGMITYSSNANADFLIDLLGEENINQRMDELELEHDLSFQLLDHLQPSANINRNMKTGKQNCKTCLIKNIGSLP